MHLNEQLAKVSSEYTEQSRIATKLLRDYKESNSHYLEQRTRADKLEAELAELKAEQLTWSQSITDSQGARDAAVLRAEEAEKVTAAAEAEAEAARKELAELQANQQKQVEEAVEAYANSEEVVFAAGVDMADILSRFVSTFQTELPILPAKLEEFCKEYDLNPAWFDAAASRKED